MAFVINNPAKTYFEWPRHHCSMVWSLNDVIFTYERYINVARCVVPRVWPNSHIDTLTNEAWFSRIPVVVRQWTCTSLNVHSIPNGVMSVHAHPVVKPWKAGCNVRHITVWYNLNSYLEMNAYITFFMNIILKKGDLSRQISRMIQYKDNALPVWQFPYLEIKTILRQSYLHNGNYLLY